MRVRDPLVFSVSHAGRGGTLSCRCDAGEIELAIEMFAGGAFAVGLRGAELTPPDGKRRRLRTDERRLVSERLRAWLDETERSGWFIER